jgi:hypothetical protein
VRLSKVGESMARLDRSFLLRWWVFDDGGSRIELKHIQSGSRTVVASPSEALAWMRRETTEDIDPASEQGRAEGDQEMNDLGVNRG